MAYKEFRGCRARSNARNYNPPSDYGRWKIDQFSLAAPSGVSTTKTLYIDQLRFLSEVTRQTRDSVVPPLSHITSSSSATKKCTNCNKIFSQNGFDEKDALALHKRKSFWQQIFRWSLKTSPTLPNTVATAKLADIQNKITKRLMNWYAGENTKFTKIPRPSPIPTDFLTKRWYSLLNSIDKAHEEFKKFTTDSQTLTSALFSRNSEFGSRSSKTAGADRKFASILYKVLHPLSLEYYIKSRSIEVDHASCEFAKIYKCKQGITPSDSNVEAITGADATLKNHFKTSYSLSSSIATTPAHSSCSSVSEACFNHVKAAIESVNQRRKEKILKVFNYLKDQGFDKGSALGSNDHAQLGMSGFFHSAFLMRNELDAAGKLNDVVGTMKWYSDFGEIYESSFDFTGTTADRLRTVEIYRLLTILTMPYKTDTQKKEKIRDMDALKLSIENDLKVNEGLGGLIKPDFTSFHHKTFYGSAYTPIALHTAALLSYMLQGTAFELQSRIRENMVDALKVLRIVAVRYSTPSSIGGRFPSYTKAVLAEHVPAYAYIAANPASTPPVESLNLDFAEVRMFRRLYDPTVGTCNGPLNEELCKGGIDRKYYLNSLGSLEIMEKVKSLAAKGAQAHHKIAEKSPEGHWSKQFAGLSIHRRGDWAVTVKGFDKFVWDFESSKTENVYGMYASHGAMLIANSESALSSKDVDKGWDWRNIPGTTVINTALAKMTMDGDRHYSPSTESMAGGVTFAGSNPAPHGIFGRNGVFGMRFVKPSYPTGSYFASRALTFTFKKSVFFLDDVIVSLGSNIKYTAPVGRTDEVHTTLFQDEMRGTAFPRANPEITSNVYRCNNPITALHKTTWGTKTSVVLVDVNGNR